MMEQLRVWWNRNGKQTTYKVNTVEEAIKKLDELANADLKNKYVSWNAGGLEVLEDGEWCEWYDENGNDIEDLMNNEVIE